MATTTATQIQQLYVGLLGRAADQGGLNWWADQVTTGGKTLEDVRASFVTSTEYTTTYGAAATRADLVTSIYQNLFERTPSADEVKYWAETDTRPADQLVAAFIEFAGAADQAVINNKTFVAQTYTDTAGTTNFSTTAAAASIADVNGTPASVTTALAAISNGTLAGLVPGVGLINTAATANAAVAAYAKVAGASNPTFDTITKDGSVDSTEATAALKVATDARALAANGGTDSTTLLVAKQADAVTLTAATKAAVVKVGADAAAVAANVKAVADFDAAVTAQAALVLTPAQAQAAAVAQASAFAGVKSAVEATGSAVTYATLTTAFGSPVTAATLYAKLLDTTSAAAHAALVTEISKVPTFGTALVASAEKEIAITKAGALVNSTKSIVDLIDSDGATVPGDPTASPATVDTNTKQEGKDYTKAVLDQKTATDLVTAAKAADTAVATAKVVTDQFAVLNKAVDDANKAIDAFNTANTTKIAITPLTAASVDATAKQDVFYFASKVDTAVDINIGAGATAFGAGDSIVLGSGYTFNAGALTAGNNSALEVFFVKGATGTQVVIETNAVGSATTVTDTSGNVTAAGSPNAAVINLVGVTADHLSFANGVVSYV